MSNIDGEDTPDPTKLGIEPHKYPDDAYPDRHKRGSYWATDVAWDILDRLPIGKLNNVERAFMCGLIAGAIEHERRKLP